MPGYEQPVIDPFTGLSNGRGAMKRLASQPSGGALLMLDLDRFGYVNHVLPVPDGGDRMLVQLAQVLKDVAPSGSFIARWSGDEFIIWMADAGTALAAAERMRAAVAGLWSHERRQVREWAEANLKSPPKELLTVSIGAAPWNGQLDITLHAADDACQEAKRLGGSRVISNGA